MPPLIEVKKAFKVAVDNGNRVIVVKLGRHDVSDRIAEVAVNQLGAASFVQIATAGLELAKPKRGRKGTNNDTISNSESGKD